MGPVIVAFLAMLAIVDETAVQYLAERMLQGSGFWAAGYLGGAGIRAVGHQLRAR